jgi:hypothetical protein
MYKQELNYNGPDVLHIHGRLLLLYFVIKVL